MRARTTANLCVAGVLLLGGGASAQSAGQGSTEPQPGASARSSAGEQITISGCIQKEADYRKAHDAGRGGAVGTGVGMANEFVLTDTSGAGASASAGQAGATTGTSGTAAGRMTAYELTGPGEGQASQYVGRRVEVTGRLKAADTDAAGRATGGATAGQPPAGVDVTSKDLKLRELEITSIRESTGSCAPMK